jgi:hypothetical protein
MLQRRCSSQSASSCTCPPPLPVPGVLILNRPKAVIYLTSSLLRFDSQPCHAKAARSSWGCRLGSSVPRSGQIRDPQPGGPAAVPGPPLRLRNTRMASALRTCRLSPFCVSSRCGASVRSGISRIAIGSLCYPAPFLLLGWKKGSPAAALLGRPSRGAPIAMCVLFRCGRMSRHGSEPHARRSAKARRRSRGLRCLGFELPHPCRLLRHKKLSGGGSNAWCLREEMPAGELCVDPAIGKLEAFFERYFRLPTEDRAQSGVIAVAPSDALRF